MNLIFRPFDGPTDWGWVNQQVPILQVEDTSGIVAEDTTTGERVGACVFDNWTPNSVQCHFALTSPMVLRHGFLEVCFDYVFNFGGKRYMYGLVPGDNAKALKLNRRLGFTEEARLPEAFKDGVDYVLMQLRREDCKFLPPMEAVANG